MTRPWCERDGIGSKHAIALAIAPNFRTRLLLVFLSLVSVDCLSRGPVQEHGLRKLENSTPTKQNHTQSTPPGAAKQRSNSTWTESMFKRGLGLRSKRHAALGEESLVDWPPETVAFVFTLISGLTLPLGALLGVYLTPSEDCPDAGEKMELVHNVASGFLAFGAGSLLFAVTVELYGGALLSMEDAEKRGAGIQWLPVDVMAGTATASVVGAFSYIWANRKLKEFLRAEALSDSGGEESCPERMVAKSRNLAGTVMQRHLERKREQSASVALSIFLGVLIDGLPEGVLLGFLAAEDRLSIALIASLFISNFPEALSASILLRQARRSVLFIVSIWSSLCLITAGLAALGCYFCPRSADASVISSDMHFVGGVIEGLAAGAMLSCIASVMIPEAFKLQGDIAGFLLVCGFVLSVVTKVSGIVLDNMIVVPNMGVGGSTPYD
eukprot:TRINITY_DN2406_c0_g3_i1.p1 TRINITY_DN2406_c0_g3~~TRINITY_DN2406_c0_g3_i1.p1  ORF type:complete len:458 (-),score=59.14 TRINITY_DN2406_c0_g3_i1:29-1351(-)